MSGAEHEPENGSSLAAAWPALLLACVLLPFLDKAFTIDDTVFLAQARHVLSDPLHPTAFEMVWGELPERVSAFLASGPTTAWLLAPVAAIGAPEWAAHLAWFFSLEIALLATAALALRLGVGRDGARVAALLVASAPCVLGMAGTVMPDVPAMAFAVIGVERYLAWLDDGRPATALASVLALALGVLGRTHLAALFLPLALLAAFGATGVLASRPTRASLLRRGWPPAAAATLVALVLLVTRDTGAGTGGDLAGALWRLAAVDPERVLVNTFAFGLHVVVVLPLGAIWIALRWREVVGRGRWLLLPLLVALLALAGFRRWSLLAPLAALGLLVLVDLLADSARRRDSRRLALALWLLVPLPAVVYVQMPPKYFVVAAPAAAILAALELEGRRFALRRRVVLAAVVGGAALGIAILRADATFAGLGRQVAAGWIAPRVATGKTVWFTGHWGFQHYAEKAGGRIVTAVPPGPAPGDFVVSALRADYDGTLRLVPDRRLVSTFAVSRPGGRILSRRAMAGFYTNWIGPLPWSWGDDEIERFDLWLVEGAPRNPELRR